MSSVTQYFQCSKSHYFLGFFALAYSKINQIAYFFTEMIRRFLTRFLILYTRHYNPRYFLPTFWRSKTFFNLKIFVLLHLGQLIVFKGMLIGIYKSPHLFDRKNFGLVFSKNFTQSQIQQKIEDKDPITNDDLTRFHAAITC